MTKLTIKTALRFETLLIIYALVRYVLFIAATSLQYKDADTAEVVFNMPLLPSTPENFS